MNQNYCQEINPRVCTSMNRQYETNNLMETPSVKNVMLNEDIHHKDDEFTNWVSPLPNYDSIFSTSETLVNDSFQQPQTSMDLKRYLTRASMNNRWKLTFLDVPLKHSATKTKTNSKRVQKINDNISMQRNSNRNAINLSSPNNIQQTFKSFDSSQINGDCKQNYQFLSKFFNILFKSFIDLEVPVSTKNLYSEIKRLRKENLELKKKNNDLTLKLKKLNELESKWNKLEINSKIDYESLVKDLSQKWFKLEEYSNTLKQRLSDALNQIKIDESNWTNKLNDHKSQIELLKSAIKKLVVVNTETKESFSKQFSKSKSKLIKPDLHSDKREPTNEILDQRDIFKKIFIQMNREKQ